MRPRHSFLRRLRPSQRPIDRGNSKQIQRGFTRHSALLFHRPQLPFLNIPTAASSLRMQQRYVTTSRGPWLRHEIKMFALGTVIFWSGWLCLKVGYWATRQEIIEHDHPTPPEWSHWTRVKVRSAVAGTDVKYNKHWPNWGRIWEEIAKGVKRLENPSGDGEGLREIGVAGRNDRRELRCYDVTQKSEEWRRGYFQALMLYAEATEHMEGWVIDRKRGIVFPSDVVIGPSNPRPKPIHPGAPHAPREEDVEPYYDSPMDCYMKIQLTEAFTPQQYMEASLALATYCEFKKDMEGAQFSYDAAVRTAMAQYRPDADYLHRPGTTIEDFVRQNRDRLLSADLLRSLSEYATFKARSGDVAGALPLIITLLKIRRSLPNPPAETSNYPALKDEKPDRAEQFRSLMRLLFVPPPYPPAPDAAGSQPPTRTAKELCEEAALQMHIGEALYTAKKKNGSSREEGLGWTREAVDVAEEQLHRLEMKTDRVAADARKTCRECLAAGLENWAAMVAKLAQEEEAKETAAVEATRAGKAGASVASSWFGLWGEGKAAPPGRWVAEEKVIAERQRRARDLLEDPEEVINHGPLSWFHA